MCMDCGCSLDSKSEPKQKPVTISISERIINKNESISKQNQDWFKKNNLKTINIMSSPGSGKTSLLQKTVPKLNGLKVKILVGDLQTENDAVKLKSAGIDAKQITTGQTCHLDASMIEREIENYINGEEDLLIIENVGNLVCPSSFSLGENTSIALLSTTEGEDKPLKYPDIFKNVSLVVITKTDLIPYLEWDEFEAIDNIKRVNPDAEILMLNIKDEKSLFPFVEFLESTACA